MVRCIPYSARTSGINHTPSNSASVLAFGVAPMEPSDSSAAAKTAQWGLRLPGVVRPPSRLALSDPEGPFHGRAESHQLAHAVIADDHEAPHGLVLPGGRVSGQSAM